MTKSLLTGITICTMLAVFVGNANAYKARGHKTHKTATTSSVGTTERGGVPYRIRPYGAGVNAGPHGDDPLYDACEHPWRHLDLQCPGNDTGG